MFRELMNPLVKERVARLRDKATRPGEFRAVADDITWFLTYEAMADMPVRKVVVETPVAKSEGEVIAVPLIVIPILRAGVGMLSAVLHILPDARTGFLGMKRNEETAEPDVYYSNILPPESADAVALLVDPMLATGGSASDAIAQIKSLGYKRIKFLCLIAAPEGVARIEREHPDVEVYSASLDERLNANFYIVPGLGDAGDRIFNTVE